MGNETINNIPNNFSECCTRMQCREFMKTYNNLNPLQYFELALTKLEHMLTEQQKIDLQNYIDNEQPDYSIGWDIYCDILTIEQIQIVGY